MTSMPHPGADLIDLVISNESSVSKLGSVCVYWHPYSIVPNTEVRIGYRYFWFLGHRAAGGQAKEHLI